MAPRPQQRLASIQRHFSNSAPQKKEIRDAYILSGSRTPTAVVCARLPLLHDGNLTSQLVQRQLHYCLCHRARSYRDQVRA